MPSVAEQLTKRPRATSFVILIAFFSLVAAMLVVFAWLFNVVQKTRLEHAREDLTVQGAPIDEVDLQKRFPTIEIF